MNAMILAGLAALVALAQPSVPASEMALSVELGAKGRVWLAETTAKNVGQQMRIVIGDEIVLSPVVNEPITGGILVLNGLAIAEATRFQQANPRPRKIMEASAE